MLNVRDLAAERAFYERLGLPVIYEGPEYPDFIGFGTEAVHFGIQKADGDNDLPNVLTCLTSKRLVRPVCHTSLTH